MVLKFVGIVTATIVMAFLIGGLAGALYKIEGSDTLGDYTTRLFWHKAEAKYSSGNLKGTAVTLKLNRDDNPNLYALNDGMLSMMIFAFMASIGALVGAVLYAFDPVPAAPARSPSSWSWALALQPPSSCSSTSLVSASACLPLLRRTASALARTARPRTSSARRTVRRARAERATLSPWSPCRLPLPP
ncbi:uncharacterized protein AMSG_08624 [Thecamonas trahens ATCC 50062]|uniref:Uncharacterized protein n=1 Tax=Thecamonas trahens ATCC 50062 TaxID=461836 RepID=A0A0L0DK21_THETB|nr:hypothetical protein AMSG_08624 [Thecamonas trahens ATCC 50062]KNC52744.1 hypothetical protein AMSG_08624 [Thecamonas trahens ATCC 50062]|eukprot:XP_013755058.1 hypothetical protein AMSG_08624 [Thecamonas trahens ATCC 50062]